MSALQIKKNFFGRSGVYVNCVLFSSFWFLCFLFLGEMKDFWKAAQTSEEREKCGMNKKNAWFYDVVCRPPFGHPLNGWRCYTLSSFGDNSQRAAFFFFIFYSLRRSMMSFGECRQKSNMSLPGRTHGMRWLQVHFSQVPRSLASQKEALHTHTSHTAGRQTFLYSFLLRHFQVDCATFAFLPFCYIFAPLYGATAVNINIKFRVCILHSLVTFYPLWTVCHERWICISQAIIV